ncbi:MAG: nucleotide exchange factor GrpE [Candidatus Thermoplasmatota archaeon]
MSREDPAPAPEPAASSPVAPAPSEAEAQVAQLKETIARARADYDNLQKRVARDAAAERERSQARVLEGFLPVFELAQMAAHQAELHPGPVSEGVVLMAREFSRLLEREGLVATGAVGEPFNATRHEAVGEETADNVAPGAVSRVVLQGYLLGNRVLRFAKVTVQPKPAA